MVTALGDLRAPIYGNDPTELLKHRFLYRGAVCLLCGPTGIGKSAFLMQAAIYWCLGRPVFGPEAPLVRLKGRQLSVGLVHFETGGAGIDDPLFGFRVYPLEATVRVLRSTRFARGYDFDPEVAVRLFWAGTPMRNLPATCRYLSRAEGGVSHFHYLRDNLRMIGLHTRLIVELVLGRWVTVRRVRCKRGAC